MWIDVFPAPPEPFVLFSFTPYNPAAMPDSLPLITLADLARAGFTHLELRCRCKVVHFPFRMIKGDHRRLTIESLAPRFRCQDCQHTPEPGSIQPWHQYMDHETGFGGAHRR